MTPPASSTEDRVVRHYDFKNEAQTCPECGWKGLGSEAKIDDERDEDA
jgi:hypothetical protein